MGVSEDDGEVGGLAADLGLPRKFASPAKGAVHAAVSGSPINYRLGSLYAVITACLYATQEPFSFPAARHLNTLQFVCLTQIALLVSIPLLTAAPGQSPRLGRLVPKTRQLRLSGGHLRHRAMRPLVVQLRPQPRSPDHHFRDPEPLAVLGGAGRARHLASADPDFAGDLFRLLRRRASSARWRSPGASSATPTSRRSSELADDFLHGSWVYAIPIPLCSALGGTLVGKWFGKYNKSAAIAANFLFANVILIPVLPRHSRTGEASSHSLSCRR